MKISDAVQRYMELRDKKSALKAEYDAAKAQIDAKMDKLEALLLGAMDKNGLESFKTPFGTPYVTTRTSVTTADRSVFLEFVKSHEDWDMLEVRPAKAAVEVYVQQHGDVPPGVNLRTERVVNVRKSA